MITVPMRVATNDAGLPMSVAPDSAGIPIRVGGDYRLQPYTPVLQSKDVAPTEQAQTIEADEGDDALQQVNVGAIPEQYIIPSGSIDLTANADNVDVSQYASANVAIPYSPFGEEMELVKGDLYSASYLLKDTGYKTWTPSTTAASIVASSTLSPTYAGDMETYEYYLRWKFDADIKYASGTTMKYAPDREIMEIWQVLAKRPSSRANIEADNFNGNNCSTFFTAGLLSYYDKNGSYTYTWSASYGFYIAATAATFSNSTSDTPTITIKTPTINARCSTTYFTTARAANVDQENSKVTVKGELWRVKKGSSPSRKMYEYLVDIYNEPLTAA